MQGEVNKKPQQLNLRILDQPNHGEDELQYKNEFEKLDLAAVKADLKVMLTNSQEWWPADYGHYGPFMLRLAWHSAGTYRTSDGRGGANAGNMRFAPHDSWPDNGNLDKARRLLWPIKKKYGKSLSWGDLMVLVGNVAMEDMGFKTFGFAGGRVDAWDSESDAYWGTSESFQGLAKDPSKLEQPLGAIVEQLIYVNPQGPDGIPDPLLAAAHIRETFGRMAMNDYETVALIAGGHTFGKCHGAAPGDKHCGAPPNESKLENQLFGWESDFGSGKGKDTITSGLEGAWTKEPTKWDHGYFHNLFTFEWELYTGPGGAHQWRPKDGGGKDMVPDAHDPNVKHAPFMLTTDMSMIKDPAYLEISKKFHADPAEFELAFAKAWYKLTHKSMGPVRRCLGPEVAPPQLWQDPVPKGSKLSAQSVVALKHDIKELGLPAQQLVKTAWASAASYRKTDMRGGTNGARIRLEPQRSWKVNDPEELASVLEKYEGIQKAFNEKGAGVCSMADLIVLAGCVGVEQAAAAAGFSVDVKFVSGRGDATEAETEARSFAVLEPKQDAFRNYNATPFHLVDKAYMLNLKAPELVVLMGGLRAIGVNASSAGTMGMCMASGTGKLNNSFLSRLLDMDVKWHPVAGDDNKFEGRDRGTGEVKLTASGADLALGAQQELRAIAERYSCEDAGLDFVTDFAKAFSKVMHNDMHHGAY